MAHYFADRVILLDESSHKFLSRLVALGGYCTVAQAETLNLTASTRVRRRLRLLERLSFLRKVAAYPVVYQVTTSTARLLGRDSGTRRRHMLATVQTRLLGVDFYQEARAWPSEFVFDQDHKIATFTECGYPVGVLPQRGGQPHLREHFVMWLPDGHLCVAMVDQPEPRAFSQLKRFLSQFQLAVKHIPGELELLIVTGAHHREQLYRRLLRYPRIQKLGLKQVANAVKVYRIRRPTPSVAALLWPATNPRDEFHDLMQPQEAPQQVWRPYDGSCWGENEQN